MAVSQLPVRFKAGALVVKHRAGTTRGRDELRTGSREPPGTNFTETTNSGRRHCLESDADRRTKEILS